MTRLSVFILQWLNEISQHSFLANNSLLSSFSCQFKFFYVILSFVFTVKQFVIALIKLFLSNLSVCLRWTVRLQIKIPADPCCCRDARELRHQEAEPVSWHTGRLPVRQTDRRTDRKVNEHQIRSGWTHTEHAPQDAQTQRVALCWASGLGRTRQRKFRLFYQPVRRFRVELLVTILWSEIKMLNVQSGYSEYRWMHFLEVWEEFV